MRTRAGHGTTFTVGLSAAYGGDHARAAEAFRRAATADDLPESWLNLAAEELALGNSGSQVMWRLAIAFPALRAATMPCHGRGSGLAIREAPEA